MYTKELRMNGSDKLFNRLTKRRTMLNTEIKNAILASEEETQYDKCAKRLLGQKIILAHILVKTVGEFQGMLPEEVVPLIEGEPYISTVPIEPGLTNQEIANNSSRIVGTNTENVEKIEGLIRFDIVFYVRMRDGVSQIIINVEAQKDEPQGYDVLNRAIFYVSRLISSQKERDFQNSNYNDIRCVYSIWICMNMEENSLCHIHLAKDDLIGQQNWKGNLDLLNIVMIGLAKELPEQSSEFELHRLLGALFSQELAQNERLNLISQEYNIPIDNSIREDVSVMCNLSQGIKEAGIAEGIAEGVTRVVTNMHNKGFSAEQIAAMTDIDLTEVEAIIAEKTDTNRD